MPARHYQQILTECLGISSDDFYEAAYRNRQNLQYAIHDTLIGWKNEQVPTVTKAQLYIKLTKAVELGICTCTQWFDFLIPASCRDNFPISYQNVENKESMATKTVTVMKGIVYCLLAVIRGCCKIRNGSDPNLFRNLVLYFIITFCCLLFFIRWELKALLACFAISVVASPIIYLVMFLHTSHRYEAASASRSRSL